MEGNTHAHNIGKSILYHSGLKDWIASSEEQYIDIAVHFSNNFEHLKHLRGSIREQLQHSICDTEHFAFELDAL
eukprot:CAMPEP_0206203916 /NCGR_PEP_ID=MMETSP0166-20121206/13182_1 /ASSEMBLY_ACC=CAM_ASM_000260 /TAXON_ID=95228 /ORGANISM="Vannella robusta, Strain DIVA3 518/3/11/1/6" /LENGTH=73 /DNA_ID=CAMNT_0053623381 /DNA_START=124 /DNA_END=341 /DNA_ORIENTATION=+